VLYFIDIFVYYCAIRYNLTVLQVGKCPLHCIISNLLFIITSKQISPQKMSNLGMLMNQLVLTPGHNIIQIKTVGKVLSLLAAFLFIATSCAHKPLQGSATITDSIIEAYGGRELLAKVRAVSAEGQIIALMRGDEGTYNRSLRRDGRLFVDITYSRSEERRILDGVKGYRSVGRQVEEVFGLRYLAMVYQYNELNLPYGFLDGTYQVTELQKATFNGANVRVLRVTDRGGNELELFVNAKDYRIVKSTGFFIMGNQSTSLSTENSDFRFVDGILFPFRVVNYAGGNKISEITMTRYLINPSIEDSLFKP
jgi:hypothetical protein